MQLHRPKSDVIEAWRQLKFISIYRVFVNISDSNMCETVYGGEFKDG